MTSLLRRLSRRRGDDGYAMILVLGAMLALSVLAVAGLSYATNGVKTSHHEQDYTVALAAAQAGVEDYAHELNVCDDYWKGDSTKSPCFPATLPNPTPLVQGQPVTYAPTTWPGYSVPGTNGTSAGSYRYQVVGVPISLGTGSTTPVTPGSIELRVWGHSGNVTRSLLVKLAKPSFLNFIYYTDIEARDPATVPLTYPAFKSSTCKNINSGTTVTTCNAPGISQTAGATQCGHHWYADGSGSRATATTQTETVATGYTISLGCDIAFGGGDSINGPLHSNDAVMISGAVTFSNPQTESSWASTANPAPTAGTLYRNACGGSCAITGYPPYYAATIGMPPSNSSLRAQAVSPNSGCLYTGPTSIVLNSAGTMTVTSPDTTSTTSVRAGCYTSLPMTTAQTVAIPDNGVVYVDNFSGSCSNTRPYVGSYPQATDATPYDCHNGDVFLQGTLNGALTIGAQNDIDVVGNTVYNGGTTGTDTLGLIANNFVNAYHPVKCTATVTTGDPAGADPSLCTNMTPPGASSALNDLTIQAAVLSVAHSFRVQNYNLGAELTGKLHIFGVIAQEYRGIVHANDTFGAHGYIKDYNYDARLQSNPPPYFLNPTSAPWQVRTFSEQ
jgi:hypothetical protein